MMIIKSLQEGNKICARCFAVRSLDSFHKNKRHRDGMASRCKSCIAAYDATRADKRNTCTKAYFKRKPSYRRTYMRAWRARNKDHHRAWRIEYWQKNKEKFNAGRSHRRWVRRAAKVAWANRFFISEIYRLAKLRSKLTGMQWQVDHIVPLNSDIVCGLHVEHNLQVIPGSINSAKGNRRWPDMPERLAT